MTAPSQDVPLATVPATGLSEVVLVLTTVGGALAALFGTDLGLRAHAQDIASFAFVVAPAVLALTRSLKHRGAQHANATVLAAQARGPIFATSAPEAPALPVEAPAPPAPATPVSDL